MDGLLVAGAAKLLIELADDAACLGGAGIEAELFLGGLDDPAEERFRVERAGGTGSGVDEEGLAVLAAEEHEALGHFEQTGGVGDFLWVGWLWHFFSSIPLWGGGT